jgi:uncharacterized RmlC-like cupin family protein
MVQLCAARAVVRGTACAEPVLSMLAIVGCQRLHRGRDGMTQHQHPSDRGTAAWHRRLHHTEHDRLSEDTAQTPGMRRYEAISGKRNGSRKIWMGKTHVGAGMVSADHHHGEAETGIYVVSGHPVFVFLDDHVERRIETEPGDYVYVPPYVPHREENPSLTEEAVVVIARSSQEGIVVNLPSLRAAVPELDRLIAQTDSDASS